jgi:hypothetical protein
MADNRKVKMTLMLDSDTIDLLKDFAYKEIGETNVSKAVRLLAKKHGTKENNKLKQ